jgi:hypothetical protein
MDGVTKQLSEYFGKLEQLGDIAVEAIKETIDEEAAAVESEIRANTPTDTGGLAASLTKTNIDTPARYGKRLEYAGENPNGVPYAKIANVLNYGSSTIRPQRFITKAVKKLRGLDDRAMKKFSERCKNIDK